MTDFGANIFDDSTPPADGGGKKGKRKPTQPGKATKKGARKEVAPEGQEAAVPAAATQPTAIQPTAEVPTPAATPDGLQTAAGEGQPVDGGGLAAPRKSRARKPRGRATAEPAAEAVAPPQPAVTAVPVSAPQWVHDDGQAVTFGSEPPAPQPAEQTTDSAEPGSAPAADARPPAAFRDDRDRRHDRDAREQGRRDRGYREHRRDHGERHGPQGPRHDAPRPETVRPDQQAPAQPSHQHPRHDRPRHDQPRHDRPRHGRTEQETAGHQRRPTAERPQHPPVALLVDMPALAQEARQQGGELALTRLGRGLAGERRIAAAVSFQAGKRPPVGFVAASAEATDLPQRVRAAAHDLARQGTALVLAPATDTMLELANELRGLGAQVELVGFVVRDDGGRDTLRLPRSCLFIP